MSIMLKRGLLKALELILWMGTTFVLIATVHMLFGLLGVIALGIICFVGLIVHAAIGEGE